MSEVLEFTARLSQVIGARPGGTEEEQQASFIIEETFKGDGLETAVEEFNCNPNYELPRIVCCIVSIVLAVLAIFLPMMLIPAIIVGLIMAGLYIMEVVGISPLNNMSKRGISQNVIGKYIPGETGIEASSTGALEAVDVIDVDATPEEAESGKRTRSKSKGRQKGARKRKIIILARYDSGKVCRELNPPIFKSLRIIRYIEMGAIALIPVLIFLRLITNAEGGLLIFWNILIAVAAVCVFLPVLSYILHQTAPYTDGANNNASGVAVMMEVARRITKNSREAWLAASSEATEEEEAAEDEGNGVKIKVAPGRGDGLVPIIHGEEAARESGMLPVDTDLIYHEAAEGADLTDAVAEQAANAEKLVADGVVPVAQPEGLVGMAVAGGAGMAAEASAVAGVMNIPAAPEVLDAQGMRETDPNVPDWFRKGIKAANANKAAAGKSDDETEIHRSRFSDALDAAAVASANSIQEFEAREAEKARAELATTRRTASGIDEGRLRELQESIMNSNMAAKAEVAAVAAEMAASEAEAAKKAAEEVAEKAEQKLPKVAELTPEEAVSKAGTTLEADVAAAVVAKEAEKAAAQAQAAEEVAEQAAVADRTISYIPVAAEIPAEISASDAGESSVVDSVGKSAADILEEASAIAGEATDEAKEKHESGRKKRSIALPSLTGAMEKVDVKHQDAPLADDAEREAGEKREALKATGRKIRSSLTSLPSTDLPPKEQVKATTSSLVDRNSSENASASVSATVVAAEEGSTTSFLAATESEDAKAALSSLDAPAIGSKKSDPSASQPISVSSVGSFVAPSSTSQFKPVGDELIADVMEEDIVIHDADDSDYTENITLTGAMAGPGYVNMPKSRASRFRSLFGRKKKRESDSISFSEAVGLEEGFDAREVGAARGGWESFQNESADYDASAKGTVSGAPRSHVDEYSTNSRSLRNRDDDWGGNAWDDDDWNGGAFSTLRDRIAGGGDDNGNEEGTRSGRSSSRGSSSSRSSRGEGSSRRSSSRSSRGESSGRSQRRRSADDIMGAEDERAIGAEDMLEEREQIRSFRTSSAPLASFEEVAAFASSFSAPLAEGGEDAEEKSVEKQRPQGFSTEVWFVALGAELADNAGIKSFIAKHSDDLSGAVVIDIDAMGAGTLSLIDEEGIIRRVKASSRMKRYVTKAGTSLGLHINSVKMDWRESAAYYTNRRGLQTIHVAGMKDGKPAYLGEIDDKLENISDEKLLENTAFVLELLNTI